VAMRANHREWECCQNGKSAERKTYLRKDPIDLLVARDCELSI